MNCNVSLLVMTLLQLKNRYKMVQETRLIVPDLILHRGTYGNNKTEIIEGLATCGVPFHGLCTSKFSPNKFYKWGNIAIFVSHLRALRHQVIHAIPFLAILEDDVHLTSEHWKIVQDVSCQTFKNPHPRLKCFHAGKRTSCRDVAYIRFGVYGEAYVSSLDGARRILRTMREYGIRGCRDQTFNNLLPLTMAQKVVFLSHNFPFANPMPYARERGAVSDY